jgi:HEAT repeat protein
LRVELLEGHQRRLRPELIRALAAHPNAENQRVLTQFLQRFDLTSTERRETAAALARQNAGVAEEDIERLITSESAGQRLLACCLVEEYGRDLGSIDLSPLVEDALPDIRLAALQAMRIQRMPVKDVAARLCHDVDPCVRASAAWTLLFEGEEEGHHCLMKALRSPDPRLSHYAGLVLAHGGQEGAEMAAELLQRVRDPLARVNLALGMVGEGVERDQAIEALVESLQSRQERWCRFQRGACLSGVSAQRLHAQELSLAQAVAEDLLTRLQVLGAVASVDPEAARAPLRQLLQGLQRQVAGQAGVQLLMEGDAQDLSLVRAMLDDPSPNVRVQAALLLAGLARDTTARVHLEAAYDQAPRETQERILESLGQLKDKASLPFLRSKVQEPFEGLRIIAASSILQVLNG